MTRKTRRDRTTEDLARRSRTKEDERISRKERKVRKKESDL